MAMVGRNAAVAEVGSSRHTVTGMLAFAAWLGVHALLLTTVRAKWAWQYFGPRPCRPDSGSTGCRLVEWDEYSTRRIGPRSKRAVSLERRTQPALDKEKKMSAHKSIQRIAIVGTGVIGASWAAYYLSRGFDVVAATLRQTQRRPSGNMWRRHGGCSPNMGSPKCFDGEVGICIFHAGGAT